MRDPTAVLELAERVEPLLCEADQALSLAGESADLATRAKALDWAATFARYQGDYTVARPLFEQALMLHRALGDELGIAGSLHTLGLVARADGDDAAGRRLLEDALARMRALGARRNIHNTLHNLCDLAADEVDYASARSLHEESLAIRRDRQQSRRRRVPAQPWPRRHGGEGPCICAVVLRREHESFSQARRRAGHRRMSRGLGPGIALPRSTRTGHHTSWRHVGHERVARAGDVARPAAGP